MSKVVVFVKFHYWILSQSYCGRASGPPRATRHRTFRLIPVSEGGQCTSEAVPQGPLRAVRPLQNAGHPHQRGRKSAVAPGRKLKHTAAILNLGLHFPVPLARPLGRCRGNLRAPQARPMRGRNYSDQKATGNGGDRRANHSTEEPLPAAPPGLPASALWTFISLLTGRGTAPLGTGAPGRGRFPGASLGPSGGTLRRMRPPAAPRPSPPPVRGLPSSALALRPL